MTKTYHLLFEDETGVRGAAHDMRQREMIPFVASDPNQGLPEWMFDRSDLIIFELDNEGFVEWVPGCGPAPCWYRKYSDFKDHEDMLKAFCQWFEETY